MSIKEQRLILKGKILTPLITKTTQFYILGCKGWIEDPQRRNYTKITTIITKYKGFKENDS